MVPKTMMSLLRSGLPWAHQELRGNRYMWLSGPITTAHDELVPDKLLAAARVTTSARKWFTERSRGAAVVYGNRPISVRLVWTF
jgi:hypothetical protein